MKPRRGFFVAVAVVLPLLACQVIVGIDAHDFKTVEPESGTIVEVPPEAASPICLEGVGPAPQPDAGDSTDLPSIVFAMRNAGFSAKGKNGQVVGFDIDRVCTCDPRDVSLHEGGVSCVPPAKPALAGSCDDDGGIDNAAGHVIDGFSSLPTFGNADIGIGAAIRCGRQNVLYVLSNYNGLANDPEVVVSAVASSGIHAAHLDGGELDGAACNVDEQAFEAGAAYPAKFDGTDFWSPTNGTPPQLAAGWVRNFQLVFDGRASAGEGSHLLPILFGPRVITVGTPVFSVRIVPLGASGEALEIDPAGNILGNGGKASSFRLEDGLLAGRLSTSDALTAVGSTRLSGGDLCAQPDFYCIAKNAICNAADSMKLPSGDFTGAKCDAMSVVLQFDAVVAQLGRGVDPTPNSDAGCASDWTDHCNGGFSCP